MATQPAITPLFTPTMLPSTDKLVASIARKAADDRNVREAARHLIVKLQRIIESDAPADWMGTADGVSALHSMHSMTECDALYELAEDCHAKLQRDLAREEAVLRSVGSEAA